MQRIFYLPLDERPCNRLFPQMMAKSNREVELTVVPEALLGQKKTPADLSAIWTFLENHISGCDCAVLSAEMLFLGGLLPSRLHHFPQPWITAVTQRLRSLKQNHPSVRLYLFQLIMRTPRYDSSDEEPDYYAQFGSALFQRAYLADKQARTGLDAEELAQLKQLEQDIPKVHRQDYEQRRQFNLQLLEAVLELVSQGVVDLLFIPQDDSCEYGYTALDQHRIQKKIRSLAVSDRVYMHPGADEAGAEMLARAYLDLTGRQCRIHVLYGTVLAPQLIPLYEDRPLGVSAAQHILACGCQLCDDPAQADLILAVNAPGRVMQESWEQGAPDVTYQSFRCQRLFAERIARLVRAGKRVAVADCAYANGGELDFIAQLDRAGVLDRLVSYKGWNTSCNTLGTTLAQGILALDDPDRQVLQDNLAYHLVDDVFYQAQVRKCLTREAERLGADYFRLGAQEQNLAETAAEQLRAAWTRTLTHTFRDRPAEPASAWFPWNRLFEIGVTLQKKAHDKQSPDILT